MGKGRLLTIDEVNNLKDGQVVWMEPCDKDYKKEIGKAVIRKTESEMRVGIGKNETWLLSSKHSAYSENDMNRQIKLYEYIEEPRIYKTSEMIAMLDGNKEFRFTDGETLGKKINTLESVGSNMVGVDEGAIVWLLPNGEVFNSFRLSKRIMNKIWTLIEEPKEVTFMEAVKAKKDYKTVKCVLDGDEMIYKSDSSWFADQVGRAISYREIIEGKWFVVESEESK